jgi:tetratricopeptide (TPR) repeat protein
MLLVSCAQPPPGDIFGTMMYQDYYRAANDCYNRSDLDGAIFNADRAIALKTDFASAYAVRGLAYQKKGDLDRAMMDFDQAIQLAPDDASTYYVRGLAYYGKGAYEQANLDYNKAMTLKPD